MVCIVLFNSFCNYLGQTLLLASLAKKGEVVHFSGFARKMNHIHLFRERSKRD
ncbi:MAG: hypothetical protein U5L45_17850 [Saprospiraceae bacterium]|nr:hypothetical protein [Saprospiraceae bacterium]